MNQSDSPQISQLAVSSRYLNSPSAYPHPDSEEALQYERHRTAQELDTISNTRTATSDAICGSTEAVLTSEIPIHGQNYEHPWFPCGQFLNLKYTSLQKFWTTHVDIAIEEGAHRDHLALERTFLAYLRTSLALAMAGVLTAQLFHLQRSVNPNMTMGFYVIGIPLSATFIGLGIVVLLVGAYRFWMQQNAMVRGKIYAGGWDINCIMILSILICTAAFVLVTTVDIMKTYF